jgi:hypothetical protein
MWPSYITPPGPAPHPLWSFFPPSSFVVFAPPRRKPRRKRPRAALLPVDRARAYASTLAADDYLEQARAALRDRDDAGARDALAVIAAIVQVVIGRINVSSSESFGILH